MEYLYESDGIYHFMNTETYDQIGLDAEQLGDAVHNPGSGRLMLLVVMAPKPR